MSAVNFVLHEEESRRIDQLLQRFIKESEAKTVLLIDKDGHLIAQQGFAHSLDTTSMAALAAGAFASTREIARLVGEMEFSVLFHQGQHDHLHASIVDDRTILVVIFDDRTTVGMVRLYAKEVGASLAAALAASARKAPAEGKDGEKPPLFDGPIGDLFPSE